MGGYRDIFEWPYAWSLDFAPSVARLLDRFNDEFRFVEYWTYKNHKRRVAVTYADQHRWVVDFFDNFYGTTRGQMPKELGDKVAAWFVANQGDVVTRMLWYGREWSLAGGWRAYGGPLGQFVANVHVEFDKVKIDNKYGGIV